MESTLPGNGSSAVNKATASAHSAIDEAARMARPAIDRAAALAHQATDKAGSAANQAADWLDEKSEQLAAAQKKLMDGTSQYVSANPLQAVGIALVTGILIGRIMR